MIKTVEYLKSWISGKQSFSIFLPDGSSEGRPFDTQYFIESVNEVDGELILKFKDDIEFIFEGDTQYRDDVCNLILLNFSKLTYKSGSTIKSKYVNGEFCLNGF